jgi:hypothetical protein
MKNGGGGDGSRSYCNFGEIEGLLSGACLLGGAFDFRLGGRCRLLQPTLLLLAFLPALPKANDTRRRRRAWLVQDHHSALLIESERKVGTLLRWVLSVRFLKRV